MKLYLLQLPESLQDYDCTCGVVVRAMDEDQARRLAQGVAGDEGKNAWLSVLVEELTADGPPGVVLRDFSAG